jgi:predicted nucleotidyltransferase
MGVSQPVPAKVRSFLSECASRYPAIERMLVFGSRARGDARERSDFDLAVEAPAMDRSDWSRFALDVEEDIPTLCGVDLLLLNDTLAAPLRTRIKEEGIVIYERAA